jgi:hypothetical protein
MALIGHHKISLHTPKVEIEIARLHDESDIDIGSNHLVFNFVTGGFAPQEGSSWEEVMDDRERPIIVVLDENPVPNTREFLACVGRKEELACRLRLNFIVLVPNEISVLVDSGDTRDSAVW